MIIVKTMDEPKSCDGCYFYDDLAKYCDAANRKVYGIDRPRPRWCPIEEVKDGEL